MMTTESSRINVDESHLPFHEPEMHGILGALITGWSAIDREIIVLLNHLWRDRTIGTPQWGPFNCPRKFDSRWQLLCQYIKEIRDDEYIRNLLKTLRKRMVPLRDLRDDIAHGLVIIRTIDDEAVFEIMPPLGNDIVVATASRYKRNKGELISAIQEMDFLQSAISVAYTVSVHPEMQGRLEKSLDLLLGKTE